MEMNFDLSSAGDITNASVKFGSSKAKSKTSSMFDKMSKNVARDIASSFNPTLELLKLATANSEGQVKKIIQNLNGKIKKLKSAGGYDGTVKKMQKIISKGGEKIKNLKAEKEMEEKAKKAEEEEREKESEEIKKRLESKKLRRKHKELDDVKNADSVTAVNEKDTAMSAGDGLSLSDVGVSLSIGGEDVSVSGEAGGDTASVDLSL